MYEMHFCNVFRQIDHETAVKKKKSHPVRQFSRLMAEGAREPRLLRNSAAAEEKEAAATTNFFFW